MRTEARIGERTRCRLAVVDEVGIGVVVAEDDPMLIGKGAQLPEQSCPRDGAGWIIGIANNQQARLRCGFRRNSIEVGLKPVFGQQRQRQRCSACHQRSPRIDGVAGVGDQRQRARVQNRRCKMRQSLLRTEQRKHLGGRVERDTEATLIVVRDGLA